MSKDTPKVNDFTVLARFRDVAVEDYFVSQNAVWRKISYLQGKNQTTNKVQDFIKLASVFIKPLPTKAQIQQEENDVKESMME